jgi:pentatricopeptide repeat protein
MDCFAKMRLGGIVPDEFTFTCILKACGNMGSCEMGELIHAEIRDRGAWFLKRNVALGNALVDMYANCGSIEKAERMLYEIPCRDVVSWSALIAGYAEHGLGDEALKCFFCMQEEGLIPNELTFASALKACGSIGSAEKGGEIHARAKSSRKGSLERNPILSTALVDMYTKCGMLAEAREVFDGLLVRDVVSWNALLMGYAQLGDLEAMVLSYNAMLEDSIRPNRVTFLVMLTMCSHAGLVCEGQMYFDVMGDVYGIEPTLEHHACMVDLFARAGHFDKAMDWIGKLDPSDRLQLWMALLGACRKWANVELGRRAFESVLAIDPKLATVYVSMRNIYVDAGMHAEAKEIEALGVENGAWEEECLVGAVV